MARETHPLLKQWSNRKRAGRLVRSILKKHVTMPQGRLRYGRDWFLVNNAQTWRLFILNDECIITAPVSTNAHLFGTYFSYHRGERKCVRELLDAYKHAPREIRAVVCCWSEEYMEKEPKHLDEFKKLIEEYMKIDPVPCSYPMEWSQGKS